MITSVPYLGVFTDSRFAQGAALMAVRLTDLQGWVHVNNHLQGIAYPRHSARTLLRTAKPTEMHAQTSLPDMLIWGSSMGGYKADDNSLVYVCIPCSSIRTPSWLPQTRVWGHTHD